MWNSLVNQVKANLDEAAGLSSHNPEPHAKEAQSAPNFRRAPSSNPMTNTTASDSPQATHIRTRSAEPTPPVIQVVDQSQSMPEVALDTNRSTDPLSVANAIEPTNGETERLRGQSQRLAAALAESEQKRANAVDENAELQADLADLRRHCEDLQRRIADSDNGVREKALMEEGQQLAKDLHNERERVKTIYAEKKLLESRIDAFTSELESANSKQRQWHDQEQMMQANIVQLESQLKDCRAKISSLSRNTEDQVSQASTLRQEMTHLEQTICAMKTHHSETMEKEAESAAREIAKARAENDALRQELRRSVVDLEKQLATKERDLVTLASRANIAESRNLELANSVSDSTGELHDELRRAESRIGVAKREAAALEAELSKTATELGLLRKTVKDVERSAAERIATLQEQLQSLKNANEVHKREKHRDEARIRAAQLRIAELTEDNERLAAARAQAVAAAAASSRESHLTRSNATEAKEETQERSILQEINVVSSAPSRSEKLLARAAVELQELRQTRDSLAKAEQREAHVIQQHDMLLQMYGQKEEECNELRLRMDVSLQSYRAQVDELARQLEEARKGMMSPERRIAPDV